MDAAVVRQFLSFFQDFISLCQWKDWPNNETTEAEIKNAFVISRHIEQCLDRFQKNNLLADFLATVNSTQNSADYLLKNCLTDPPKYIFKKIINSNTKITQMDIAFQIFLHLFSEEKLENYLADFMLEAASKETLLKNLSLEIPRDKILSFKSEVILSHIKGDSKEGLQEMLNSCDQDIIDLLVVSLCCTDSKYQNSVNVISECFLDVLISKDNFHKKFWRLLFNVEDKYLINMCVENSDLYTYICEALIDCGKLLKENMSMEYFYIEFTYSELFSIIQRLFTNEFLKSQFLNVLNDHDSNNSFWKNMLRLKL